MRTGAEKRALQKKTSPGINRRLFLCPPPLPKRQASFDEFVLSSAAINLRS
jgi:hypothetical protein